MIFYINNIFAMKKIFIFVLTFFISLIFSANFSFAAEIDDDYIQIYNHLMPADFTYIHDIDPEQYYDMQNYAYSPYPLFRLNSPIYFKSVTVEPGYYNLTPREHNGEWYVLFKDNGKVKYYIPCYKREIVPLNFYETHLPKPKLTFTQKVHIKFISGVGRISKCSKRRSAPKTYLEFDELDNEFYSVVVYYGDFRYFLLFKASQNFQ